MSDGRPRILETFALSAKWLLEIAEGVARQEEAGRMKSRLVKLRRLDVGGRTTYDWVALARLEGDPDEVQRRAGG